MDDLYHRAEADGAPLVMRKELGPQQQQCRTKALPSPRAQMFANISDGAHVGDSVPPELPLNGHQIVAQQVKHFFGRGCGWCTQKRPLVSVIGELHIDPKILLAQQGNDLLQRITVLAAHPHRVSLN